MKDSPATNLLADLDSWSTWIPRQETEPQFEILDRRELAIAGGGNPIACGCWRLALPDLAPGRRYRIDVAFQADNIDLPGHSVWAIVTERKGGGDAFYDQLDYAGMRDERHRMSVVVEMSEKVKGLTLCLFLAWSAEGRVRWSDVSLADVTDAATHERTVGVAAISGSPEKPTCPMDCMDFYAERIHAIEAERLDLVCLPETINTAGAPGDIADLAESIPGPCSERLAAVARERSCYLGASFHEREGERIYNTALLIDRSGELVGKYRKTHITIGEGLVSGIFPGDTYPVFETDFGRVGFMICYDAHYPEVSRILALHGAELILNPNMGDGREGGILWEPVIRTRAIDNQVHIAAAVNGGRSCVVSPKGEVLSMTDRTRGAIAYAECELGASLCDFTGRPIRRRYERVRRVGTYATLLRDVFLSGRLPDA